MSDRETLPVTGPGSAEPSELAEEGSVLGGPVRRLRQRTSPRRRRVSGGRQHRHEVKVSAEEEAALVELAAAQQVSVPRLLVEAALAGGVETSTQRRELIGEFASAHRLLARISSNVNQLAHTFNTVALVSRQGQATDEDLLARLERDLAATPVVLEALRRVAERLDDAAEELVR